MIHDANDSSFHFATSHLQQRINLMRTHGATDAQIAPMVVDFARDSAIPAPLANKIEQDMRLASSHGASTEFLVQTVLRNLNPSHGCF